MLSDGRIVNVVKENGIENVLDHCRRSVVQPGCSGRRPTIKHLCPAPAQLRHSLWPRAAD